MGTGSLRRRARRAATALAGGSVVGLGVLLLPLPGPGTAIIAAGLAILAREFPAARRLLNRALDMLRRVIRLDPPKPGSDR